MVLGIVMMTAMLPTMIGLNEASKGTRDQEDSRRNTARKQRCHLVAMCSLSQGTQSQREQVHNARVYVGRDGKLYITKKPSSGMSLFNGGFYTHPDFPPDNSSGVVTITGEQPPLYDGEGHVCGPFDWTKDEQCMKLEGWEGWLAIRLPEDDARDQADTDLEIGDGREIWRLYFDQNDDGADLPPGSQGLEIRLKRVTAES
ncbi:uncharacterized protein N7506_012029 [Penicillium brevicompactum]|uniref:uncharacterized protein n=1 Tax=Penicillium brevicompactum TaxID=5074 RepID=UPI0025421FCB|nr:uncharacterized protein N7506_012029 [Penicillium brevicompactum]KAJ5319325.1 hypothetical protein N7506_012029 [Penicillium brevicompactum]